MGLALVNDPPFLLSAGIAILVFVTARETIPAWYSSLGSSPVGTPLIRVGASRRTPFSVVPHYTSPLRMVLGVHVLSRMFLLYFVY